MAQRSASDIYASLRGAGFGSAQAVVMTAVALAESGGSDTSLGDVGLENSTWGPSYGLFQVRTLKAQTGSGTDRDVSWLAASDANQAKAAYDISKQGSDFTPWTTYTRGTYQQFLGQAQAAAATSTAAGGGGAALTGATGPFPTWGPGWLPWNLPSDAGNAAYNAALGGARSIVIQALAVTLGLGLVGVGLVRAFTPQIRRAQAKGEQAAKVAAKVAVL